MFVQNNNGNNVFNYICFIYIYTLMHANICELNDYNESGDQMEELGLFCYYKVLTLSIKHYGVI